MKKPKFQRIIFKGSAANTIFACLSVDIEGEKALENVSEGTELHAKIQAELEKQKEGS